MKYLGDAVYAGFDGRMIELWTSNGIVKTNRIFLEPEVVQRLLDYIDTDTPYGGIKQ